MVVNGRFSKIQSVQGVRMRLKQWHILSTINYVSYESGYTVQMRHIFSTNEDVEYEQGASSSFEKGRHYSKMFLNESLMTLTGVSIKNI